MQLKLDYIPVTATLFDSVMITAIIDSILYWFPTASLVYVCFWRISSASLLDAGIVVDRSTIVIPSET